MTELNHEDVRFRGKPITELTRDELLEALLQALNRVHVLDPVEIEPGIFEWTFQTDWSDDFGEMR